MTVPPAEGESARLRSHAWFSRRGKSGYLHRSRMKSQGMPHRMFDGRPVIGICNTWSELAPCNAHFRTLAEHVRRGVYEAGGFPLEFPVLSLGETLLRPTSMLYRNLASMDVEESLRANPLDGVVLLCGCDKTTPALLMGAASADIPAIVVSGGPALTGRFRGRPIGSGTAMYAMSDEVRAGTLGECDFIAAEACESRSAGHCNTMGTASTMASIVEVMGLSLPGNAAIPAPDARRAVLAHDSGRRIVEMVREDLRLSHILTRTALENAIRTVAALGGSTNAVVHLLAIAGRLGVPLSLSDFDDLGHDVPLLANLQPAGQYLMEDFFEAGGLPALLAELGDLLHLDAPTVNGRTLGENLADAQCWNPEVIRPRTRPVQKSAGIAVLTGNLAPDGAIIKPSAASPELLRHRGRAVVFDGVDDLHARIDDPALDVDATCVLVLKNAGPRGYPGMPELGNLPIPAKLLQGGVTDMVRISDARMSGTAYGTVVLHTAPEAAVGGPLALVEDRDLIELDVPNRSLHLHVSADELAARRARWSAPTPAAASGYTRLYVDHVTQANHGADFDFLTGARGAAIPRDSH
ncbi:IlvD/Edd family dehydratase [Amycolatopsis viridis]|uniref:Dihydroxy-acid dehydratase n=1 Tax=Amycolatopsis viridis TaxID=185678 RepID=A0ABX0SQ60_9PSEU|nr:IlvD/Edd family dehydratase [Amycolatopsis viridis]NIH79098.1 dihydroxy-acid dehydratase [Amycolatopsis viridis]